MKPVAVSSSRTAIMGVMHRLIILSYKVYTPAYAGQVPIGMCTCLLYSNKIFKYRRKLSLLLKTQLFIKRFHLIASRSHKIARFHARLFGSDEHLLDKARSIAFPLIRLQNGDFLDFSNVFRPDRDKARHIQSVLLLPSSRHTAE